MLCNTPGRLIYYIACHTIVQNMDRMKVLSLHQQAMTHVKYYNSGKMFTVIFPDGTGQVWYPLTLSFKEKLLFDTSRSLSP